MTFEEEYGFSADDICSLFLAELFGYNVTFLTKFEMLESLDKETDVPEFFFTEKFRFMDFWYNPEHQWVPQLAHAVTEFYCEMTGNDLDRSFTEDSLLELVEELITKEPLKY